MFHTSHYDYMCIQSCSPRRHHAERKGSCLSAARRVCGIHLPISILVDLCFQRKSMQFSAKILWQTQIISNHPIIFFDSERGGYTFTLSMSNNGYWWDIQLVIFNHEILWYSATIRMMVFRMATGCLKSWHPPKHFPCTQISMPVAKKTFMTCILWYAYDHYLQLLLAVGHDMTWFNCDSIDSMYVLCIPACRPGSAWHRSPRRSAQRWKRVRHVRSDEANSLKVVTLTNMNIYIYTQYTHIYSSSTSTQVKRIQEAMWFLIFQMKMRSTVGCLHHSFSMSSMFQWFLLEKNIYEILLKSNWNKELERKHVEVREPPGHGHPQYVEHGGS